MTKFYIYKITLESGKTYIGSHIEKKENDGYNNSSRYIKRHPEDKIIKREILFYLPTLEQMNIMETITIISDKCESSNNINGNYGNWLYNFHTKLDCPWNKNLKMSKEFCQKISETEREPIICLETNEVFSHTNKVMHAAEVINGKRKSVNGLHYRKLLPEDSNIEIRSLNNKKALENIYKNKKFILNKKTNKIYLSYESMHLDIGKSVKYLQKQDYITEVSYKYILDNNLILPTKAKQKAKVKKKIICVETKKVFSSIKDASVFYNTTHISDCLSNKRNTAGGYHWEYV